MHCTRMNSDELFNVQFYFHLQLLNTTKRRRRIGVCGRSVRTICVTVNLFDYSRRAFEMDAPHAISNVARFSVNHRFAFSIRRTQNRANRYNHCHFMAINLCSVWSSAEIRVHTPNKFRRNEWNLVRTRLFDLVAGRLTTASNFNYHCK